MIDRILQAQRDCAFDFRRIANPADPLKHLFPEWDEYYRLKAAIAAALQPRTILEIGVRYGYSAAAFLHGAPHAHFTGIDLDSEAFGGQPGAIEWARRILPPAQTKLIIANTQGMDRFPGGHYDLIHVDGQQDGDGTFRDLTLASRQATYVLLDGYLWTRPNFLATSEFLFLHRAAIEYWGVIPGYAGELLIKFRPAASQGGAGSAGIRELYDQRYYLRECGGWESYRQVLTEGPQGRLREVLALALASAPRTLLDLGCGRGEIARAAAEHGCAVQAVDYAPAAVELTRQLAAMSPPTPGRVTATCADAVSYRSPQPVDCIVLADVIEHLSEAEADALLANAAQQLAPGGRLILHTAPNRWFWQDHYPRRRRAAAAAGFYLPPDQRTHFEREMHLVEQSPARLRRQLQRHFPHVVLWLANAGDPAGNLLRKMGRAELTAQIDIFAVASSGPLSAADLRPLFQSAPLNPAVVSQVNLTAAGPISCAAGGDAWLDVELENKSSQWLVSHAPNPVHLSYHLTGEGKDIFDGARTRLIPPLGPGRRARYRMKITAPQAKGRYRITPSLVQESIRWFEPGPAVVLEVT